MTQLSSLTEPLTLLSAVPWVLLLAAISGRLLGIPHQRWWKTLISGFAGWALGIGLAFVITSGSANSPTFVILAMVLCVIGVMGAAVGFELLAPEISRPPLITRLTDPIDVIRSWVGRTGRYLYHPPSRSARRGLGYGCHPRM